MDCEGSWTIWRNMGNKQKEGKLNTGPAVWLTGWGKEAEAASKREDRQPQQEIC